MTDTNPAKFTKLVTLLRELFQLDQPDLDFGIYRIMHAKAGEVTQFLERDLLPQVKDAFTQYQSADSTELKKKLDQMVAQLTDAGVDPETAPKVKELREQLKGAIDIGALENETYDHLFSFFRRYYSEGDFLAKRVYRPGVYAIPYEGEEVTLHWANKDQYYIKTSEYLRDYAFRLKPQAGAGEDTMRVHFKLVDAVEGEHGNVKAAEGKDRVFVLAAEDFIGVENGELELRFEYRPATLGDWAADQRDGKKKPPAQKDLTAFAVSRILAAGADFADWLAELGKTHVKANGEQADYSVVHAKIQHYTKRNTFDYFIHKDLGGFLRRELDFYIKNEVMHLDDVESETAPKVEQYLSKVKVIRRIAGKIIDFLAQLENFQKKLWLKKKFVVGSDWLVAISQVPDELLPEICANEAQLSEWKQLHSLHELPADVTRPPYSEPLTTKYLRAHQSLMLDTRHFDASFEARLLESVGDVDGSSDGVLLHGDNFQAISLVGPRFDAKIQCIYIDPPYNTGDGDFPYKDAYQHSSWLSMMANRLSGWRQALRPDGSFVCHIDEHEFVSLERLIADSFGEQQQIGPIIWDKRNPKGDAVAIATQHEYICWAVKDYEAVKAAEGLLRRNKENAQEILKKASDIVERSGGPTNDAKQEFKGWLRRQPFTAGEKAYSELDDNGDVYRPVSMAWPNKKKAPDEYFEPLIHPVTGKPCPVPARGWRNPPPTMRGLLASGLILFGRDESTQPTRKYLLRENLTENAPSILYFGGSDDDLQKAIGYEFPNPKPTRVGEYVLSVAGVNDGCVVIDAFGGSGTTAHAVLNLNRADGGSRKFVLIEQGSYFYSVLAPRLKKVAFTPEWKDGRPGRLPTQEEVDRSPSLIKVLRLESYEDTLNNLTLSRSAQQQAAMDFTAAQGVDGLREQYILRYQLNVESRDSASLLNIAAFTDPTAYKLQVKTPSSDENREVNVDLLETFNWLLGLAVQHIAAPRSFSAEFERDSEHRLQLKGRLKQDAVGPWWFRTVTGTTPEGRKTLVIWRKLTGNAEQDNLVLETWFRDKQAFSVKDSEFDLIYVNGDNTLENLRLPDESWKVRLTEEDFHRLMFEGTEA